MIIDFVRSGLEEHDFQTIVIACNRHVDRLPGREPRNDFPDISVFAGEAQINGVNVVENLDGSLIHNSF